MSTRRNTVIVYGYSVPCEFEKLEKLEEEYKGKLDFVVDGMCGDYALVGKKLVDAPLDDDWADADGPPVVLGLSMLDQSKIKAVLKRSFP